MRMRHLVQTYYAKLVNRFKMDGMTKYGLVLKNWLNLKVSFNRWLLKF